MSPVLLANTIDKDFPADVEYKGRFTDRIRYAYSGPDGKPLYFIKQRFWSTKGEEAAAAEKGHQVQREDKESFGSVLRELSLSTRITELVNSEECQAIIRANGFKSIEFVPPLGGIVRKGTTQRYMIYPHKFVNNHHNNYMRSFATMQGYVNSINELTDFFIQNGINPYDIEGGLQFDNDNPSKLILLDTEGFIKIKPGENAYTTNSRRLPMWEDDPKD
jgi:hypothetical protein